MPCQHREADDADEHAAHLTDWEQRYDQLSAGRFHGGLTELQLPQMQVFVEHTSHALRQSCRVWDDAFWFGLAARADGAPARINGRLDAGPGLMTRPGGTDFELVTPDRHAIYGVVVRRPWIEAAAAAQGCEVDWTRLRGRELLPLSAVARRDWLALLEPLLDGAAALAWHRDSALQLQALMLCPLLGALDGAEVDPGVRASQARRHALVARAQALVLATPEQPPSVPQLCERLHLSRRTLQYCFEDVLGLSPLQALRALRLNGARRSLREAAARGQGVQDVAAQWGFGHLSQFAADYRRLFGESPSQALRRAA
ncbi:transcriptional regulator, AraC family [Piscinibacter sakaiensis]|uniref:Transcriptional regulator, AraC family n=1 Tax=Piscinibacter sakaiensis TaxID=1547922 RepID=A0A0K8P4C3_PISS1|nr:transcriptional regulator, AraC family [Piscinibacter sakaiensis]